MSVSVPSRLARCVPSRLRQRGNVYRNAGRVEILATSRNAVEARVRGTHLYRVRLRFDPVGRVLLAHCDCPHFATEFIPCKHVWAALSESVRRGALRAASSAAALEPASPEEIEEAARASSAGTARQRRAAERPSDRFSSLVDAVRALQTRDEPCGRQRLLYEIDVNESELEQVLLLRVLRQKRLVRGGWGARRPVPLGAELADWLAELDPDDQRLFALLSDAKDAVMTAGEARWYPEIVALDDRRAEVLLPWLCASGRLHLIASRHGREEPGPALRWDPGEPYAFELRIERTQRGASYKVGGTVVRGEERIDISAPELLLDRFLLFADRVARWRHSGALPLAREIRSGSILLPDDRARRFVSELLTLPAPPPLELPPALSIETVALKPQPILEILLPENARPRNAVRARVLFGYEEARVCEWAQGSVISQPDRRRLITRDIEAERRASARLDALGVPRAAASSEEGSERSIPVARFAEVVRTLLAEKWQVEAETLPVRRPATPSVSVSTGIDWFELRADVDFGGQSADLPSLLAGRHERLPLVKLADGSYGLMPEAWLDRIALADALASGTAAPDGDRPGGLRFARSQTGLIDALLDGLPMRAGDGGFERLRRRLQRLGAVRPAAEPSGFRGTLRPYQREGLGWMKAVGELGLGGCLADDMGLGKTVQVLALLQAQRLRQRAGRRRPSLVVVPRSVLINWRDEAARFTPRLAVRVHHGPGRSRSADDLSNDDVVLTTYGTLMRDLELLRGIRFDYVVLDEAQAIKNAQAKVSRAVRALDADRRLALTGTPVENHLGELWALLDFLNPGLLGRSRLFQRLTRSRRGCDAPTREILARAVRPFLLRRTKRQVAPELPERSEQTLFCELGRHQRRLYDELRRHYRAEVRRALGTLGLGQMGALVLEGLLRLRQAACHVGLIDGNRAHDPSAKLDLLDDRLDELVAEGHKALVFSQFTKLLAIVRRRLEDRGIPYAYLDGRTRRRAELVQRFQTDAELPVFLISLKAGGLGLNLTAASYVFLLDPWWNPAVEAQAIDRTHRIGQTRRVSAYRLVAKDTVEERIIELQAAKRELADAIYHSTKGPLASLSAEELEFLFS